MYKVGQIEIDLLDGI